MLRTVYCISGMGADEKIFSKLIVRGFPFQHIPWLRPLNNETLAAYASRMSAGINDTSPVIIGVSFGGMIAIEIAKQRPVQSIIIISSVKSRMEIPAWMKMAGGWKLDKILPLKAYGILRPFLNYRLGASDREEKKLVDTYRDNMDPVYLNWAVHQVLNWKNETWPGNLVHIHGDKDKIFPVKNLHPTYTIKDGTHLMIFNRAGEIARCLEKVIQSATNPHS